MATDIPFGLLSLRLMSGRADLSGPNAKAIATAALCGLLTGSDRSTS
jgi:hypothetical protein